MFFLVGFEEVSGRFREVSGGFGEVSGRFREEGGGGGSRLTEISLVLLGITQSRLTKAQNHRKTQRFRKKLRLT